MIDLSQHFTDVATLCNAILEDAGIAADRDPDCIDENRFAPRISQLKAISRKVAFSADYHAEQRRILREYKAALAAMPDFRRMVIGWPSMPSAEKAAFLEQCLTVHARIQSKAGFPVKPAALGWMKERSGWHGTSESCIPDRTGIEDRIDLNLNSRLINDAGLALGILAHEQTHIFHTWLARAGFYGDISEDHALSTDAGIMIAQKTYEGNIPNCIESAYREQFSEADPWYVTHEIQTFIADQKRQMRQPQNALILGGMAVAGMALAAILAPRTAPKPS